MEIDKIRDYIVEKLSKDYNVWNAVLNNTQPEDYACNRWKVEINPEDIRVDVPNRTFSVDEGFFSCEVTLASDNDQPEASYNKAFTAKGIFQSDLTSNIKIDEIDIAIEIDIF
ncbi:hypothetical protein ACMGDK_19380 [Chryseobacterium sp. DT-3]|uniref:hypothetical protein n=1 Tax=Chryseobacterium sp. DT-3 TaxID=3396164 RepID=UPI003F1B2117